MTYVLLLVGFILLIKGADFFVEGSSSVAKKLKVPSMIIGLTIVAMGTSLPECAVSVTAAIGGNNELAVSNVVGSNMFNLMVVCGASALFAPLAVQTSTLKREFPFATIVGILLLGAGYLAWDIGRVEGLILVGIFAGFLCWTVKSALKARKLEGKTGDVNEDDGTYKNLPIWRCILYIVGGMVAIVIGGDLVVDCASEIALNFGLSQNLVGLTIVAMGTSLPELVTSVVAARKNEVDMALGNVLGSNIFNILLVLGVSASISPVAFLQENLIDAIILLVVSVLTWIFAATRNKIARGEGIILLLGYAGYMAYICMR